MKSNLALLTLCFIGIYATSFSQQAIPGSAINLEEIETPSQLKRLQLRTRKGMEIPRLFISYPLKKTDHTAFDEIIAGQSLDALSVEFEEAPDPQILKKITRLKVLEIGMKNPDELKMLSHIGWKNIEYASVTIDNAADIFKIPVMDITSPYFEIYQEGEDDLYAYTFRKDEKDCRLYISRSALKQDSVNMIRFLTTGLGTVVSTETDIRREIPVDTYTEAGEEKDFGKNSFFANQTVPEDHWVMNTNTSTYLRSSEGTFIFVPEDAFVTASGKPYRGFVDFTYRQWNSTRDLFDSGLPLYDIKANNDTVFYITNGMYELRAYGEEGEELSLANNKSVGVRFPLIGDKTGFNVYAFNETAGTWDEKGTVEENESTSLFTDKTTGRAPDGKGKPAINTAKTDSSKNFSYGFDTTHFTRRYSDLSYTNLVDDQASKGMIPVFEMHNFYKNNFYRKKYTGRNIIRPKLENVRVNDSTTFYRISFSDQFYQRYPEVRYAFTNRMWVPKDVKRKEFRKNFYKYPKYNDFTFRNTGNNMITLELKANGGFHTIEIQASDPRGKKKSSGRSISRMFKKYDRFYKRRERIFDASITRKMSDYIRGRKAFLADSLARINNLANGSGIMYATLNTRTLGLTNIDHPYIMPQKTRADASYIANGIKISRTDIAHVQIMDASTAGIFQFSGASFIYSKKNIEHVIITLHNGDKYMASSNAIHELKTFNNSLPPLEMIPFEENKSEIPQLAMQ